MAENKEVAVQSKQSFSTMLSTSLSEVRDALPKDFNVSRFVQNAVALLNENTQLLDFAKKNGTTQIKQGMMKAGFLGLDFMSHEAYLIPYGSTLNFMIDYRGAKKLAKKYSIRRIKDIYAKLVREGDDFEETVVNGIPSINFNPKPFNNGKIIGAFAVALFEDGGITYDTMSLEEMNITRSKSKAKDSMAWKDFTGEMYKKTVLHRLCKSIEIEFDTPEQRQFFDDDVAIETDTQKIVDRDIAENANTLPFDESCIDGESADVQ